MRSPGSFFGAILRCMGDGFTKAAGVRILKASGNVLIGWGVVSKVNGVPLVDRQGDHIPEAALYDAVKEFSKGDRPALLQHGGEPMGRMIFSFPMTDDVKKSLGIQCEKSGWLVGVEASPEVIAKFDDGDLTGFSIGGRLHEFSEDVYE